MARLFVSFLAVWLMWGKAVLACETPKDLQRLKIGLVAEINSIRAQNGLSPVVAALSLHEAAQGHACDMQAKRYFDHQAPEGPGLGDRVKKTGYRFGLVVENIALTPRSQVGAATEIWMSSPPHRKNILNPQITEIGFGIATRGNRTLWVMDAADPQN